MPNAKAPIAARHSHSVAADAMPTRRGQGRGRANWRRQCRRDVHLPIRVSLPE